MQRQSQPRAPLFFPLTLVLAGVVLLLNNYLLINADLVSLWPAVLILIGLQVAWRGDLAPSWQAQSFGITRGTVESASLEISSAEIDVRLAGLNRAGRLIAGEYTARSRPKLVVRNNHATILMQRGSTWLFSLADWNIQVAQDVPWAILLSSHLGELSADLRGIPLRRAYITSGFGDLQVIAPEQATGPVYMRSTFGDVQLILPRQLPALIRVQASPLARILLPAPGLQKDDTGQFYATAAYQSDQPFLEITVAATFGNITLSLE